LPASPLPLRADRREQEEYLTVGLKTDRQISLPPLVAAAILPSHLPTAPTPILQSPNRIAALTLRGSVQPVLSIMAAPRCDKTLCVLNRAPRLCADSGGELPRPTHSDRCLGRQCGRRRSAGYRLVSGPANPARRCYVSFTQQSLHTTNVPQDVLNKDERNSVLEPGNHFASRYIVLPSPENDVNGAHHSHPDRAPQPQVLIPRVAVG